MAVTAWTEQDYNAGFRRPVASGFPYLRASLAAALICVNLFAVAIFVRINTLDTFVPTDAMGRSVDLNPTSPSLLAIAGPKAAEIPAASANYAESTLLPDASALGASADITDTDAYDIAYATVEAPVVAEPAVPPKPYIADRQTPAEGELPARPIPYMQLAANNAADGELPADANY